MKLKKLFILPLILALCSCNNLNKSEIKKSNSFYDPDTVEQAINRINSQEDNRVSSSAFYVFGTAVNSIYDSNENSISFYFKNHEENSDKPFKVSGAILDSNIEYNIAENGSIDDAQIEVKGFLKKSVAFSKTIYEIPSLEKYQSPTGEKFAPILVSIVDPNSDHTHTYGEWIVDQESSKISEGSKHKICTICGYTKTQIIPKISEDVTRNFTLYSFNDFHGAVKEQGSRIGLAKFATYLKNVSRQENTLIIDSGDTFQGSIESNSNYGSLITDVFNYAHVDVHTIGNHDFDWGEDIIETNNIKKASDGFKSTYLGANIYDYDFENKTFGDVRQTRLGDDYYIKTLENGLKIGVIGAIGKNQITSISSYLVQDIGFKEHIKCIKNLSDKLRTEDKVDVVIASVHNGAEETLGEGLSAISPVSNKRYCDYVTCGHTHEKEIEKENGVFFTQAACYGEYIMKSSFTFSDGSISSVNVSTLTKTNINNFVSTIDPNVSSIIATYEQDYKDIGNEVLVNSLSGTLGRYEETINLLSKAMYTKANEQGFNVDLAVTNEARSHIYGPSITYAKLYEAFPFDNTVYIIECTGQKNIRQLCYDGNGVYHKSGLSKLSYNSTYKAAVIDYLLFHVNSSREYDYYDFSNLNIIGSIKDTKGKNINYRNICADFLRKQTGTLYSSDYEFKGNSSVLTY